MHIEDGVDFNESREGCSFDGTMHYSFDYAQQVHILSNPLQPGKKERWRNAFQVVKKLLSEKIVGILWNVFVKNVALLKLNSLKNKISFKKDFICNDTYVFFNYCDKGERKTCPFWRTNP